MKRGAGAGVIQRFLAFLDEQELTGKPVGIAISGGRDSTALAICAAEARNAGKLEPVLVHIDHGVRPGSSEDRGTVRESAEALDIPLLTSDLYSLGANSTEAEMREARYLALHSVLSPLRITAVLTGHHARDQAETVLLHLSRGQGLEGATGISPLEMLRFKDVSITVARPFLQEDPVGLSDLVGEYGLPIVDDPTNEMVDRARNVVRYQVLPLLSEINAGAIQNMARSAEILRDEHQLLAEIAREALDRVVDKSAIDSSRLTAEPIAVQRRALRAWVQQECGLEMTFDRTEALRQLASAGSGNVVLELGDGWQARQAKRRITLHKEI